MNNESHKSPDLATVNPVGERRRVSPVFLWVSLVLAVACVGVFGQALGESPWHGVYENQGVAIFAQHIATPPKFAYKGVGLVPCPLERVGAVLVDFDSYPQWFFRCRELRTVSQRDFANLTFLLELNAPWPVADRDVVFDACSQIDLAAGHIVICATAKKDALPKGPAKCIRVTDARLRVELERVDAHSTRVTFMSHADPGGRIGHYLARLAARVLTYRSLVNLKKQAEKPEYENAGQKLLVQMQTLNAENQDFAAPDRKTKTPELK